jgi:hypothetical protein
MARYRKKDEVDLAWNALRAAATARINLKYKILREREVDDVLGQLWTKFERSLASGELLELEPEYERWVRDALPLPQFDAN